MGDDFFASLGYSSHFSDVHGGRESGSGSIAFVGGNDTATTSVVSFNANPDYHLLERLESQTDPYFPKLQTNALNHMHAHKGLLGFKVMGYHPALADDSKREYGMDRDQVTYIDTLNGMGQAGNDEVLIELADKIRVMGLVEEDIKAGPSREAGSPLQNNLIAAGKKTMPNTGPITIRGGQKVMWTLPTVEKGSIKGSSTDLIENIEKGLAPLITVPYIPTAHKGSPQMIYRSLLNGPNRVMPHMNKPDSTGTFRDSRAILDSIKGIILIGAALMAPADGDEREKTMMDLKDQLHFGETTDEFSQKLIRAVFDPLRNPMIKNANINVSEMQMGSGRRFLSHATTTGSTRTLSSRQQSKGALSSQTTKWDINMIQARAFIELYESVASLETRFRERIIGLAYTTASRGRDMDVLLNMAGNGSI